MNTVQRAEPSGGGVSTSGTAGSVQEFVEFNASLIDAGCELLSRLDDEQYAAPIESLSDSTIGGHVRHCLDFYEALLTGAASGTIDYDTRPREALIENDRNAALARLESVKIRLRALADSDSTHATTVKITSPDGRSEVVASSFARELETAANHTIHHYAIIAIFARARGLTVDPSFGLALSTRRFRSSGESKGR